jgi:outer membrane receptor for ferrienterochelin and colicin
MEQAAPEVSQEAAKKSCAEFETAAVLLKTKRESQTVNDVVAAEDVGNFPYKNVADALQRVSGASISREFGEGERVSTCNHLMLPS